jgi:hypothetical protein
MGEVIKIGNSGCEGCRGRGSIKRRILVPGGIVALHAVFAIEYGDAHRHAVEEYLQ